MKKYLINFLIFLLIFVLPIIAIIISNLIEIKIFKEIIGLQDGSGMILIYILLAVISAFCFSKFQDRLGFLGVAIPLGLFILIFILLFLYVNTIKFTIKISPFYLSMLFGLVAGYFYVKKLKNKIRIPIILSLFPLIMSMGINELWVHKIEYGNWTGEVSKQIVIPFEFTNKSEEIVTNESLKGKIILFDFWFINCGPCWVKFPEVQRIYEQYQSNSLVEIYAVNRPMSRDKPGDLFTSIEDKKYTFPVLKGTQESMDALGVYKYPTVMLLNENGKIVFIGELEDAEKKLESLLASIQ